VTGGAGFIGSHLVRWLLDSGRDVIAVDDMSRGSLQNLNDLKIPLNCLIKADLRDRVQASHVVRDADTVFHLAAKVGSVEYLHGSEMAELEALQDNLLIDVNVIRACLENRIKRIVYTSSVAVYPIKIQQKPDVLLSEDDLQYYDPEGGYGWAKLLGEMQLGWIKTMDIGVARVFNVYGEGEPFDETTHVIPALTQKAIMYPKEDFVVWGSGDQTRCFIYVYDCVDALMRLEEKACNPPMTVNVGSDKSTPIKTIAEKIIDISKKNMHVRFDRSKLVGPLSRAADIRKVKAMLGWEPSTSLDEGLKRTYLWAERRLRSLT